MNSGLIRQRPLVPFSFDSSYSMPFDSDTDKIFKTYKQQYFLLENGRSLHTQVEKLNFYVETAL